ncbi:MAG: hypothetical protein M5R36_22000 [Deltaproteobacteria bacterium]|nr:hypothetical protein [Deltaproteobacteria bacterium]
MTVIGVLSDTHIRDGDDVSIIERVAGQELGRASIILHAGDLVDLAPFESIFTTARFTPCPATWTAR